MRSPLAFCDSLGLTPTPQQFELLTKLAACPENLEVAGDERQEVARAVCIFILWRVLSISGSSAIILAPNPERASELMRFLEAVTKRCNADLAQVSGFPRWNVLQFAGRTGWEVRIMPNKAALVREKAPHVVVSAIFNASSSEIEFTEAAQALEQHSTHEKSTLIRVW